MRVIEPNLLWIGNAGDVRHVVDLMDAGIRAVVDLAANEPIANLPREIVYCRFPLIDGTGNERWLLRAAIDTISELLRGNVPTLVACSAGMSRSPALAAAAIARVFGRDANECLLACVASDPADVSPALWNEVVAVLRESLV